MGLTNDCGTVVTLWLGVPESDTPSVDGGGVERATIGSVGDRPNTEAIESFAAGACSRSSCTDAAIESDWNDSCRAARSGHDGPSPACAGAPDACEAVARAELAAFGAGELGS